MVRYLEKKLTKEVDVIFLCLDFFMIGIIIGILIL